MKVRVTFDVTDEDRLIMNEAMAEPGLAPRAEVEAFINLAFMDKMAPARDAYMTAKAERMHLIRQSLGLVLEDTEA